MLTLQEYADREGISYSAACERRKSGKIKTVEKQELLSVTKSIKRIYVIEDGVKLE